jgi:hypothetical protein
VLDVAVAHLVRGGVHRSLPGDEDEVAGADHRRVGSAGFRRRFKRWRIRKR